MGVTKKQKNAIRYIANNTKNWQVRSGNVSYRIVGVASEGEVEIVRSFNGEAINVIMAAMKIIQELDRDD